jgi:hypothetical protein
LQPTIPATPARAPLFSRSRRVVLLIAYLLFLNFVAL